MCGIAGIIQLNNKKVNKNHIPSLLKALEHRGPDDSGYWINKEENCSLVHTRLSILDTTEAASQPMGYMDGRYKICFNGEIFNFVELKTQLSTMGYTFYSESDTEVIMAGYHHWGKAVVNKFNGMWAFAIYDANNQSIFLSRDRFGIKPLYYFTDQDIFIFSSEVQAIHKILGKNHPLNKKAINEIIGGSFYYHGKDYTYLKNVLSLPSGHELEVKDKKVQLNKWYGLNKIDTPKKFDLQVKKLKELIVDACKIRLRSDVPIATCLSGGIDSGGITAIINTLDNSEDRRFNKYSHKSYCASFPNTEIDELEGAKLLASKIKSDLDVILVTPPKKEELEKAMGQCDGPMSTLAFFPIWLLYKRIKESGTTVTLDGQGPDEMLGGYRPVEEALTSAIQLKNPFWFVDVFKTYASLGESKYFSSKKHAQQSAKKILKTQFKNPVGFIKDSYKLLTQKEYYSKNNLNGQPKWIQTALDISLYNQFFKMPLPGILNQFDRCSMAHGIECRMPYMDYRIVEFIFSLPVKSKVGKGYTKRVLREALKDLLPTETLKNKNKIGFNAPIVDWFKGSLSGFMLEIMQSPEFQSSKHFNGQKLLQDYNEFLKSPNPSWNLAWTFWPPVHLTWWLKHNTVSTNV